MTALPVSPWLAATGVRRATDALDTARDTDRVGASVRSPASPHDAIGLGGGR
jgi:hypothetical protein